MKSAVSRPTWREHKRCSRRTPSTSSGGRYRLVDGQPNEKQVGDKGVDGRIRFHADKDKIGTIIVSVKGGGHVIPTTLQALWLALSASTKLRWAYCS